MACATLSTALFPPSTNDRYGGAIASARFLTLVSVLTILPGAVHVFLPDGGAGTIAGIDLGPAAPVIIALFAWAGATQIAFGIVGLVVSLRHRDLVPLMLALIILERLLHAVDGWLLKTGTGHHPPEHYAVVIILPLLAIALIGSLRPRPA
jgi:hypothetical protein